MLVNQNTAAIVLKSNLMPGDWVKMAGIGFDIYGKVTNRDPQSKQIQIVTSTVVGDRSKIQALSVEMHLEKINMKDVPQKALLWILERIRNPPDAPNNAQATLQAPGYQKPAGG